LLYFAKNITIVALHKFSTKINSLFRFLWENDILYLFKLVFLLFFHQKIWDTNVICFLCIFFNFSFDSFFYAKNFKIAAVVFYVFGLALDFLRKKLSWLAESKGLMSFLHFLQKAFSFAFVIVNEFAFFVDFIKNQLELLVVLYFNQSAVGTHCVLCSEIVNVFQLFFYYL
jgi:hypothetical protein